MGRNGTGLEVALRATKCNLPDIWLLGYWAEDGTCTGALRKPDMVKTVVTGHWHYEPVKVRGDGLNSCDAVYRPVSTEILCKACEKQRCLLGLDIHGSLVQKVRDGMRAAGIAIPSERFEAEQKASESQDVDEDEADEETASNVVDREVQEISGA